MKTFEEKTTVVGVSELRTKLDKILNSAKDHKVLIERRNKNLAVLIDITRYQEIERMLDMVEEFALGNVAKERSVSAKFSDYIPIKKFTKKIKKK